MLARLARVLLAVALLAAWQGALLHPLEHVDPLGEFVHLADGHSHDHESDTSGSLCDALAALTACAPGAAKVLVPTESRQPSLWTLRGAPRAADAPPFLSQGPPALL